jgi:hypothetical protein
MGRTGRLLITTDGPPTGLPATGQTLTLEMIAIVTFDDTGKAIGELVVIDGDAI